MIRFNPSLRGSTIQLKFVTLQAVLVNVFTKRQEYVGTDKSLIHLFYPENVHVWYPGETFKIIVGSRKRERESSPEI
jgi:hypothetical protein